MDTPRRRPKAGTIGALGRASRFRLRGGVRYRAVSPSSTALCRGQHRRGRPRRARDPAACRNLERRCTRPGVSFPISASFLITSSMTVSPRSENDVALVLHPLLPTHVFLVHGLLDAADHVVVPVMLAQSPSSLGRCQLTPTRRRRSFSRLCSVSAAISRIMPIGALPMMGLPPACSNTPCSNGTLVARAVSVRSSCFPYDFST